MDRGTESWSWTRRTGQHPFGGPRGSSRTFPGSRFCGGGGSSRNFPGSIFCGVAQLFSVNRP